MANPLETLVNNVQQAESVFGGFGKSLLELSNASSKAGKRWTIFSRLVSGTPLWAVQNKIRAYVDILAQIDEKQKNVNAAQLESMKQTVKQIDTFNSVKDKFTELSDAFEVYRLQEEALQAASNTSANVMDFLDEKQRKLIESTNEYKLAIAAGYSQFESYSKAMEGMNNQYNIMEKNVNKATKALEYQRLIKTKEGREELQRNIDTKKDELRARGSSVSLRGNFASARSSGIGIGGSAIIAGGISPVAKLIDSFGSFVKEDFSEFKKKWENRAKMGDKFNKFFIGYQTKMLKLADAIRPVMKLLTKYLVLAMFVSMGILVLVAAVNEIKENFEVLNIGENVQKIIGTLTTVFGDIVGLVNAIFGGKDIETAMGYLDSLLASTLDLLLQIGIVALKAGLAILVGVLQGLYKVFFTAEYSGVALSILGKFAVAFLALYFVKYLAIKLLEIAAIYALPVLIVAGLALVLAAIFGRFFGNKLQGRATGGMVNENMTLVGERGPELVSLPRGSKVYTNNQTKKMTGSVTNNFNITINAKDTSDAELRRIADKLGSMINSKINRRNSSSTMR